jgi:hypothetical protein
MSNLLEETITVSGSRQAVLGSGHLIALLFAITITLCAGAGTERPDLSQYHAGTIVSVRELRSSFPIARWSRCLMNRG